MFSFSRVCPLPIVFLFLCFSRFFSCCFFVFFKENYFKFIGNLEAVVFVFSLFCCFCYISTFWKNVCAYAFSCFLIISIFRRFESRQKRTSTQKWKPRQINSDLACFSCFCNFLSTVKCTKMKIEKSKKIKNSLSTKFFLKN